MATGIAPKSCTALFPLWSFGKMDIENEKEKNISKDQTQKALKGILIFTCTKNKNKKYTFPDHALTI